MRFAETVKFDYIVVARHLTWSTYYGPYNRVPNGSSFQLMEAKEPKIICVTRNLSDSDLGLPLHDPPGNLEVPRDSSIHRRMRLERVENGRGIVVGKSFRQEGTAFSGSYDEAGYFVNQRQIKVYKVAMAPADLSDDKMHRERIVDILPIDLEYDIGCYSCS
jgi:hypothetical protein